MLSGKKIETYFKTKHKLAVGQITVGNIQNVVAKLNKLKLKVRGRCFKTGRKKIVSIPAKDLLNLK